MSRKANIMPVILDIAEFFMALADLKMKTRKAQELRTSDGKVHQVEAVFEDATGREVGVQKTDKGYKVVADCEGLTPQQTKAQTESIQKVVQRYSYRKVRKQLEAQGYSVAEEKVEADGSVRLRVARWVA